MEHFMYYNHEVFIIKISSMNPDNKDKLFCCCFFLFPGAVNKGSEEEKEAEFWSGSGGHRAAQ